MYLLFFVWFIFVCGHLAVFPSCSQFLIPEARIKDTLNVSSAECKGSLTGTSTGEGSPHSPLPNTVQDTISLTCGQGTLLVHFQLRVRVVIIPLSSAYSKLNDARTFLSQVSLRHNAPFYPMTAKPRRREFRAIVYVNVGFSAAVKSGFTVLSQFYL